MSFFILVIVFIILMMIGIPVTFSMGVTGLLAALYQWGVDGIPFVTIAQRMLSGMNSFTMLAVPLFLLYGRLMNEGEITERMFYFARKCVGHWPGGLAHVNILNSIIFAGMSGTAVADAAGPGQIEIRAMTDNGFDLDFAIGVSGGSALIGPIIPPSVPMVIYGAIAECSIATMFIGGIIPGLLMAIGMSIMVLYYTKKRKYPREARASGKERLDSFKNAFLPLLAPVIIIGGIWCGVFTPTEAAAVAVVYGTFLILVVYRNMTLKEYWGHIKAVSIECAGIMFMMAGCNIYSYMLTRSQLTQKIAQALINTTDNSMIMLFLITFFLLIIGCFMGTTPAILLFAPIFVPVIKSVGFSVEAFGVIMCLVLCIGQLTPPFGSSLFVLAKFNRMALDRVAKACLPFCLPVLVVVLMCILCPTIITFLPNLLDSFGA